jgi:hypothetical protein
MTMNIFKEMTKTRDLLDQLSDYDWDADDILNAIQSETNLEEAIESVVDEIDNLTMLSKAAAERAAEMSARSKRLSEKASTLKTIVLQAMEIADQKKLTLPTCTISKKKLAPKVIILEESDIPADYFKIPDPKVDTKALLADLKNGEAIPGATLSNGGLTIQIRKA